MKVNLIKNCNAMNMLVCHASEENKETLQEIKNVQLSEEKN